MPNVKVYNTSGAEVGEMDLKDDIFGLEYNEALIHQAVVTTLSNQRQGTKSTLTRAEVRGGGKKPWRQKGTGRARHGSIRSPIWTGGGMAFALEPRDFSKKMNIKAKRQALKSALSQKVAAGDFIVLDEFNLSQPKTKEMAGVLDNLKLSGKILVVTLKGYESVIRASGNLPDITTINADLLNTYDVVNNGKILITKEGVGKITEVFA
ncbi:MAG: 50S ribosomal protein L4 [Clostridia bacterium]|nr:50S ribosomal protein L4 [Clostridia bacterium]